jgi:uncharacterized protein
MIPARARFFAPFLLLLAAVALAEVPVPALKARVTDLTRTLSADQVTALERKLAAFEQKKGSQIAVLIVPSVQPETIEQYGIRVAEQWKLGRKGVDDGALLLVAKDDRRVRIEVGYGLEGVLPDATAKRIVDEVIVPRFREGEFAGGIDAGVTRMIAVVEGEPLPPPPRRSESRSSGANFESLLGLGFVLVFVVGGILRSVFGRLFGATLVGGITGIIAWAMMSSLIGAAVLAIIAFALTLMGGAGGGWHNRGGWGGGGWSGGGWSGGGGGGGWSGGGGGFGGGGASGRW